MTDFEFSKWFKGFVRDKSSTKYFFMLAIFILLLPFLYRHFYFQDTLIGDYSYYHAEMSDKIGQYFNKEITLKDLNFKINPYDLLLYFSQSLFSQKYVGFFLPISLGVLSLLLLILILKQNKVSTEFQNITLFLTLSSPLFIYLFSQSNQFSLIIFLNLLAFYLFFKKKYYWLSIFIFLLISFFGTSSLFLSLILLWAYSTHISKEKKFLVVAVLLLLSFIIQKFLPFQIGLINYVIQNPFGEIVSDLGGVIGIGIMHLALFLFGFILFWADKNSKYSTKIVFLIMFLSIFYVDYTILIYYNFLIYLTGALAIIFLLKRKWYSLDLKQITMLIIICGLLFSTLSYVNRISFDDPTPAQIESLKWMKNNVLPGKVLSLKKYGFLISDISHNFVFNDRNSIDDSIMTFDQKNIFFSRLLNNTQELLKRNNISYIWITSDMKNGSLWTDKDQGLLFLFRNNKTFKQIYNINDEVEIWEVSWVTRHYKFVDNSDK